MSKKAKTIEEQIQLLKSRNLVFRNEQSAGHLLKNISYYRLKGYWWEMQDDKKRHTFKSGSIFEEAVYLYNFDRRFRLIVFGAIERIEIALRTKMIYYLSLQYGAHWYLDSALFHNKKYFSYFQQKAHKELSRSTEEFITKHYKNHPQENPESWKALEVLSLGALSKLFENLKHQLPEKSEIARDFGLYNQRYLASWMRSITLVRNIVAHHGRLWNRVVINKYDWPKKTMDPILDYTPNNYQRRKLFPLLSAILYLCDKVHPTHHVRENLLDLFEEFDRVPMYKMGFPKEWESQPIWLNQK